MPAAPALRTLSAAVLLACAGVGTPAATPDAPRRPPTPCEGALDAMHDLEQRMLAQADQGRAVDPQDRAELQRLQKQAARACLGGSGEREPPPQSVLQPPVTVPSPPPQTVQRLPPPAPVSPPPQRLPAPAPPTVTTSCNPSGCWNSEGQFMPRMGPALSSPRGLCTVQPGGVLSCP